MLKSREFQANGHPVHIQHQSGSVGAMQVPVGLGSPAVLSHSPDLSSFMDGLLSWSQTRTRSHEDSGEGKLATGLRTTRFR